MSGSPIQTTAATGWHTEGLKFNIRALTVTRVCTTTILIYHNSSSQVRNQLGTPGGAKRFLRGAQFFELCPILLNYVQHIFIEGEKKF